MTDAYHLAELQIALDRTNPANQLPPAMPLSARILDIGCGAGQTMIAAYPDRQTFGIDVDSDALRLGQTLTTSVAFTCGRAEALPYRGEEFDLVVARVSLAYTDIAGSLREIHRVLREDGVLWMTLHPLSLCWEQAKRANWKGRMYFLYVLVNGLCFHVLQKQFSIHGRQEAFQTAAGMTRALEGAGFRDIQVQREKRFLVTARRSKR